MPCFINVTLSENPPKFVLVNLSKVECIGKAFHGGTYLTLPGENRDVHTDEKFEDFITRLPQSITL